MVYIYDMKICILFTVMACPFLISAQTTSKVMEKNQQMLSCKLTSAELQLRKKTVLASLRAKMISKSDKANGFEYQFTSDDSMLDELLLFIKTERQCCDFFDFAIRIEGEAALLSISGPEGSKEFLRTELEL